MKTLEKLEDCLEVLVGLQIHEGKFNIEKSDFNVVTSLARQTFRGIGFTDRQAELAREKICFYESQFLENGIELPDLSELRIPLRSIDRSRWIKIVDTPGTFNVTGESDIPWIAVRFIFQKKLINSIDKVKNSLGEGLYDKESKIHYFPLTEKTCYAVLTSFNEHNGFEVEKELQEYFEKLQIMKNNKEQYLPGIYSYKLKNLHEKSFNFAISSIGEPNLDNLCNYYDQKDLFGLYHFDEDALTQSMKNLTPLAYKIANRKNQKVFLNNKTYTTNNIIEVVLELNRFPLLVILHETDCYDKLVEFTKGFNNIIPNESCSVLFRLDNDEAGKPFNQYIKDNGLNNPVDKNTKIVYINSNKVPKPLIQSDWIPNASIVTYSGRQYGDSKTELYLNGLDLIVYYDNELSPFKNDVEKI